MGSGYFGMDDARRTEHSPAPPPELWESLARHGQDHLLRWWPELTPRQREELVGDLRRIPFAEVDQVIARLVHGEEEHPDISQVEPVEVHRLPGTDGQRRMRRLAAEEGERMLTRGEVAVVVVAGGQGTRLGFDGPKGTFPIGPVSRASLFQIHAEKILALSRRHGHPLPLYVMTSPENHDATTRFFAEHDQFGLPRVRMFTQGQMPAVDRVSGKILLAEKGRVALSPDGHGGTLSALAQPGPNGGLSCLQEMRTLGVRTIFYYQVDNPFVQIADPAFLGLHHAAASEVSFKVIEKLAPEEKLGVVVRIDGVPQVIEYSNLPPALAEAREVDHSLRFWAGSIAVHLFEIDFMERVLAHVETFPFHRAFKKVPYVDDAGQLVTPDEPNAVKFERFIFDTLPLAQRWVLVETDRALEFEPLKNATGPDSPESVRRRMTEQFADWLEAAGMSPPREPDGSVRFDLEISPLYALDAAELRAKLQQKGPFSIEGPLYLRPEGLSVETGVQDEKTAQPRRD